MLQCIDRIQIATADAASAAEGWRRLLGAEPESTDRVRSLAAKRSSWRVGRGLLEFLEPDGTGAIDSALKARGRGHLFAAGVATEDFDGVVAQLNAGSIETAVEHGQAFFDPAKVIGVPCPMVLSRVEERPPVGRLDTLYEVTLLTADADRIVERMADLFGLNAGDFAPISSKKFGYSGVLTLFHPDRLHRFEVITPATNATTMGRYFERNGPSWYMSFAETAEMTRVERTAGEIGAGITVDRPQGRAKDQSADQMWLHPPALGGVMLGLSRPTMAWTWSGRPERVETLA
jgi:hypothetical protein